MNKLLHFHHWKIRGISLGLIVLSIAFFLSSCSTLSQLLPSNNKAEIQLAEVLFKASLPQEFPEDSKLMLEILDDVTGIYFNASRFEMTREDATHFSIRIPLKVSTDLKYRYVRVSDTSDFELNSKGQEVRFRIARLDGPQIIQDIVTAWPGSTLNNKGGKVTGQVIDRKTNAPIPNLLICIGGNQAITMSDGSFAVTDLTSGVHNLVIYSMDGAYPTFQQGALVSEGATTPVLVYLERRPFTKVRFEVNLPNEHPGDLPLRFISNLSNLGNSYTDLSSGSSGSSVNYPTLTRISTNRYFVELELPVGLHLRYKYSFGDGFWNTELSKTGNFIIRDLVIQENQVINNRVSSFLVQGIAPVTFSVKVPESTPPHENVYIQLKPFNWTEPLPMVSRGSGLWEFTIYAPMQYTESLEYRFCRNGNCDLSIGDTSSVMSLTPLSESQTLTHTVINWSGLTETAIDSSQYLVLESTAPRPGFIAGVEFTPAFYPGWRSTINGGLSFSNQLGGDYVILTPTSSVSLLPTPELAIDPDVDLQWQDLMTMINHVTMSEQKTLLFPTINYAQGAYNYYSSDMWSQELKDTWFDEYQRFLYHYADLAQIMEIDGLVIGEPSTPYLKYQQDSIDTTSLSRAFSSEQWDTLINGLRDRYSGPLIGVMNVGNDTSFSPTWLEQVDMIYVLLSPEIESQHDSVVEIKSVFDSILNQQVKPISDKTGKPVIVGISYPSSEQAKFGLPVSKESQIVTPKEVIGAENDLELQAKIYSAAVLSCATTEWVQGFISRGFFPYLELQDASSSIYRKPASEILWFWFHYLLNKAP